MGTNESHFTIALLAFVFYSLIISVDVVIASEDVPGLVWGNIPTFLGHSKKNDKKSLENWTRDLQNMKQLFVIWIYIG